MHVTWVRCMTPERLWAHVGPVGLNEEAIREKTITSARVSERILQGVDHHASRFAQRALYRCHWLSTCAEQLKQLHAR